MELISKASFSPGDDCFNTVKHYLENARNSVIICVFTISDNRISEIITDLYHKGLDLRIITDNDKRFDEGSDVDFLIKSGIRIKADDSHQHMHHKFAVIDNKYVMTGSFNWTRSASRDNYENLLVINDKNTVNQYVIEFEKLWNKFNYISTNNNIKS